MNTGSPGERPPQQEGEQNTPESQQSPSLPDGADIEGLLKREKAATKNTETSAPVMLSRQIRRELMDAGLTAEEINNMTPQEVGSELSKIRAKARPAAEHPSEIRHAADTKLLDAMREALGGEVISEVRDLKKLDAVEIAIRKNSGRGGDMDIATKFLDQIEARRKELKGEQKPPGPAQAENRNDQAEKGRQERIRHAGQAVKELRTLANSDLTDAKILNKFRGRVQVEEAWVRGNKSQAEPRPEVNDFELTLNDFKKTVSEAEETLKKRASESSALSSTKTLETPQPKEPGNENKTSDEKRREREDYIARALPELESLSKEDLADKPDYVQTLRDTVARHLAWVGTKRSGKEERPELDEFFKQLERYKEIAVSNSAQANKTPEKQDLKLADFWRSLQTDGVDIHAVEKPEYWSGKPRDLLEKYRNVFAQAHADRITDNESALALFKHATELIDRAIKDLPKKRGRPRKILEGAKSAAERGKKRGLDLLRTSGRKASRWFIESPVDMVKWMFKKDRRIKKHEPEFTAKDQEKIAESVAESLATEPSEPLSPIKAALQNKKGTKYDIEVKEFAGKTKEFIKDFVKKDFEKFKNEKRFGISAADFYLNFGTGFAGGATTRLVLKGVFGLAGIAVGAAGGAAAGAFRTALAENRRINREFEAEAKNLGLELGELKGAKRFLTALGTRGRAIEAANPHLKELKELQEKYKVDKKKIAKAALIGALGGAFGAWAAKEISEHYFSNEEAPAAEKPVSAQPQPVKAGGVKVDTVDTSAKEPVTREWAAQRDSVHQDTVRTGAPTDTTKSPMGTGEAPKQGAPSPEATSSPSPEAEKLRELAIIRKGEGVSHAVWRQLAEQIKADPEKFGLRPEDLNSAKFSQVLNEKGLEILKANNIIRADGTEIRIRDIGTLVKLNPDNTITIEGGETYTKPVGTIERIGTSDAGGVKAVETPADAVEKVTNAAEAHVTPRPLSIEVTDAKTGITLKGPIKFEYDSAGKPVGFDPHDVEMRNIRGNEFFSQEYNGLTGVQKESLRFSGQTLTKNMYIYEQIKTNPEMKAESEWLLSYIRKSMSVLQKEAGGVKLFNNDYLPEYFRFTPEVAPNKMGMAGMSFEQAFVLSSVFGTAALTAEKFRKREGKEIKMSDTRRAQKVYEILGKAGYEAESGDFKKFIEQNNFGQAFGVLVNLYNKAGDGSQREAVLRAATALSKVKGAKPAYGKIFLTKLNDTEALAA